MCFNLLYLAIKINIQSIHSHLKVLTVIHGWITWIFDYVLPCSFKSLHGYACMERISKLIDLIDKLILIPFKSPHGYAWLNTLEFIFYNFFGILLIWFKSPNGYAWLVDIQISWNKYTTNRQNCMIFDDFIPITSESGICVWQG